MVEEVKCQARAFTVGGVGAGAVRNAVGEEDDSAGGQFNLHRLAFIRITAEVMIAVRIAAMFESFVKVTRNDFDRAIGDCRIVNGRPHCRAAPWDPEF